MGLRDLVAYYVDTNNSKQGYHAVGKNVMVLKEYEVSNACVCSGNCGNWHLSNFRV